MSSIPTGVILIWTKDHSGGDGIPDGWTRETTLDGKFPKGHGAENPNTNGGNATHTHTSPTHSHNIGNHTHSFGIGYGQIDQNREAGSALPDGSHLHEGNTTDNPSAASTSANAVTYGSTSNEPPYKTVIFIKPSAAVGVLKSGICAHFNGSVLPPNWYFCDGDNSTSDYRDKYLKGASTGANAGGTGGSVTNVHDISHNTHTGVNHTHNFTSVTVNPLTMRDFGSGGSAYRSSHNHSGTTGNSSTYTVGAFSGDLTAGETVEPGYKKMGLIQSNFGQEAVGLIGLWLGSVAAIPPRWQVCDGTEDTIDMRDKFIKIPTSLAGNGASGGSNAHTHAAQGHVHTGVSHNHSVARLYHWSGNGEPHDKYDGLANETRFDVYHEAFNVDATTDTWASGNTTADSSDSQPPYKTVAYIQLMKVMGGGAGVVAAMASM